MRRKPDLYAVFAKTADPNLDSMEALINEFLEFGNGSGGFSMPGSGPFQLSARDRAILSEVDPRLHGPVQMLLQGAHDQGISLMLTEGKRTAEKQQELYEQGRAREGAVVTHAKPGQSKHEYGLAVDVAVKKDGQPTWPTNHDLWHRIGKIGKEAGLKWGGDFKEFRDYPHFELPISWEEWSKIRSR